MDATDTERKHLTRYAIALLLTRVFSNERKNGFLPARHTRPVNFTTYIFKNALRKNPVFWKIWYPELH